MSVISVDPHELLTFEQKWPEHTAAKEALIAARWGITAVRYYQLLARHVATAEAIAADPFWAARVRQQRAGRAPLLRESAEHSGLGSVASTSAFELPA